MRSSDKWLLAIRPATLPASASGVIVGLGAARAAGAPFRLDAAAGCMAVALLLQIAANLANDLSDFRRGADTPDRLGPTRVAASGLVTVRQLELAIGIVLAAAAVAGVGLALIGGPIFVLVGLGAMLAALAYTGGPFAYGYHGLGEVFVFAFFGLVAVAVPLSADGDPGGLRRSAPGRPDGADAADGADASDRTAAMSSSDETPAEATISPRPERPSGRAAPGWGRRAGRRARWRSR
jgi:hypothetical protein